MDERMIELLTRIEGNTENMNRRLLVLEHLLNELLASFEQEEYDDGEFSISLDGMISKSRNGNEPL